MWLKSWEKELVFVNPFCSERDCGQPKLILENSQGSTWHGTLQLLPGGIFPPTESQISWKIKTFQQQIKPLPARPRERDCAGSEQEIPLVCAVSSGQLLAVSTEQHPGSQLCLGWSHPRGWRGSEGKAGSEDRDGSSSTQPRNATALMDLGREGSNTQEAKIQGQDFEMYFKN